MKKVKEIAKSISPTTNQIIVVAVVLVVAYFFYNLGAGTAQQAGPAEGEAVTTAASAREETIWTCSMHPQIKMNEPEQCPICGMDLVPMETEGQPAAEKKQPLAEQEPVGYACAMNCVPPLPNPGKCPICGMEMVPVFEEVRKGEGTARRLTMSREARALASIQTSPVERRWIENEVRMVGNVDYDETKLNYVTAYVGGRLDRLYVDYTGIEVKKGDHMVYLYSPDLITAQEELIQARRAYENLSDSSIASVKESARKALAAVRERLRLWGLSQEQIQAIEERNTREDHITIYAPIGGTVIKKHVNEGAYVKTGDRIYTIADFSTVWVQLQAYESDLPWIRYGQDVVFTTDSLPGEEFHGRISFIGPVLDPGTRTVDVRVNVPNKERRLKPGMFVRAKVFSRVAKGGRVIDPELAGKWISPMHPEVVKDEPGACDVCGMPLVPAEELGYVAAVEDEPPLVIPESAPLITGKRAVVYVEVPGERPTYEGREIVLGPKGQDHYLVIQGLEEGERVVTHGAFKIDSALQIVARPSMMSPEAGAAPAAHVHDHAGADMEME
jgi:membrane fusion protein, copper/silver efflux system